MSEDSVVSLPPITNSETTKVIKAFYEICFTEILFVKCFEIDEYMLSLDQKRFLLTFETLYDQEYLMDLNDSNSC